MGFHSLVLDDLRSDEKRLIRKAPFEHQLDAFEALTRTFSVGSGKGKGGLLVFPTGDGKTFTTFKWVCDKIVPRNIRVLWLANSYYLPDQALACTARPTWLIQLARRTDCLQNGVTAVFFRRGPSISLQICV